MADERPHVVIVGAGFGGLWAAKRLAKTKVTVTLIDQNNFHTFFPLLYQVAAAELQPADIAYPIRSIIRRYANTTFLMGSVTAIQPDERVVIVDGDPLSYDHLIFAPGSHTRYFGVEGAEEHAFGLRTLDDALTLRNHLLASFEAAASTDDPAERGRLLTFVIVGGGPTGVEFAGALQEFLNGPFRRDFKGLSGARVVVVEAGERLLSTYPERLSAYAVKRLARIGVEVRLGTTMQSVGSKACETSGGTIDTESIVWTAGVGGDAAYGRWGLPLGRGDTVTVQPDLSVESHPDIFVIGDIAHSDDNPAPMVAQNALQQGRTTGDNIARRIAGKPLVPFRYRDLGNMAVIGRNAAVVHLWNRVPLTGFVAWVIWLTVHLAKLIGFRNRLAALVSWTGDYFFGDRVARLIIPSRRTTSPRG